jgi:hypothetical protein
LWSESLPSLSTVLHYIRPLWPTNLPVMEEIEEQYILDWLAEESWIDAALEEQYILDRLAEESWIDAALEEQYILDCLAEESWIDAALERLYFED